jgi:hypothetical protein
MQAQASAIAPKEKVALCERYGMRHGFCRAGTANTLTKRTRTPYNSIYLQVELANE